MDFIGYDHIISLNYSVVLKSKKDGGVRDAILKRVQQDREYIKLSVEQKNNIVKELYDFYKKKEFAQKVQYCYEIDIDKNH